MQISSAGLVSVEKSHCYGTIQCDSVSCTVWCIQVRKEEGDYIAMIHSIFQGCVYIYRYAVL